MTVSRKRVNIFLRAEYLNSVGSEQLEQKKKREKKEERQEREDEETKKLYTHVFAHKIVETSTL